MDIEGQDLGMGLHARRDLPHGAIPEPEMGGLEPELNTIETRSTHKGKDLFAPVFMEEHA
jgi:hypothetical protein